MQMIRLSLQRMETSVRALAKHTQGGYDGADINWRWTCIGIELDLEHNL